MTDTVFIIIVIIILSVEASLSIIAVYGMVKCIEHKRFRLLLISLIGVAGLVACHFLPKILASNAPDASNDGIALMCGTDVLDRVIEQINEKVVKISPLVIFFLLVSCAGVWAPRVSAWYQRHFGPGARLTAGTADPRDMIPLVGDARIDSVEVQGPADEETATRCENIDYCHADRTLVRVYFDAAGGYHRELLLDNIPETIGTQGELIAYAKAQGVQFQNRG